jgi:hypothetical protein
MVLYLWILSRKKDFLVENKIQIWRLFLNMKIFLLVLILRHRSVIRTFYSILKCAHTNLIPSLITFCQHLERQNNNKCIQISILNPLSFSAYQSMNKYISDHFFVLCSHMQNTTKKRLSIYSWELGPPWWLHPLKPLWL